MLLPYSIVPAALSAIAVFAASYWWFGSHRRRQVETAVGVAALASMKWRDCLNLILKVLERDGYREDVIARQPGNGGGEHVLNKGGQNYLLSYKHGTAYRLGEANVRELANAMSMQGLDRGILVTLGGSENFARDAASRSAIELLDGEMLWPRIRAYVPADLMGKISEQANLQSKQGVQWGIFLGLLLGVGVFLVSDRFNVTTTPAISLAAPAIPSTVVAPAVDKAAMDAATLQAHEAADAIKQIASLTDLERAQRRVRAAADIAKLAQVSSAVWSTQSTLNITLHNSGEGDQGLIDEACRILVQFEELRFTRLQLEPPPGSTLPVRWRQCQ